MRHWLILLGVNGWLWGAISCDDFADFKEYKGHFYALTSSKYTFAQAKVTAQNARGYLAIPETSEENDFLAKNFSPAWIGIHDPSFSANHCLEDEALCPISHDRFKTIKGENLLYAAWDIQQPDNRVYRDDVMEGRALVAPLGEHWVVIGSNGKWGDFGNHARENNNPIRFKGIIEFEEKPECAYDKKPDPLMEDRKCSTAIYNTGHSSQGIANEQLLGYTPINFQLGSDLFSCQQDQYGNEFCPTALAPCAEEWDYDEGYSTSHIGTTTLRMGKEPVDSYMDPRVVIKCARGAYDPKSGRCIYGGLYQIALSREPDIEGLSYWRRTWGGQPSYDEIKEFVYAARRDGASSICGTDPRKFTDHGLNITAAYLWYLGRCPEENPGFNAYYSVVPFDLNNFLENAVPECDYRGGNCPFTPPLVENTDPDIINQCASGYTYNSTKGKCHAQIPACPADYKDNGQDCTKTIEYTYYTYHCRHDVSRWQTHWIGPRDLGGDCGSEGCNSPTPPPQNCKRQRFSCVASSDRPCAMVSGEWQCSPFPCFGESNLEEAGSKVGSNDIQNRGFAEDGTCTGQIRLFNGKDMRCRSKDSLFGLAGGGCCQKEKPSGLGGAFGVRCKEEERILAKYRKEKQNRAHEIGEYCSKKLKLGFAKVCVQRKKSYCVFNSKLARIIHEQGRAQIGISWGEPSQPHCQGFTPEEFQKIDFSKVDLSEFYHDLGEKIKSSIDSKIGTTIQNKMNNFHENISGHGNF